MAEFVLLPALIWGLFVGLYELFAIHADEGFVGTRWFSHGLHSAIFAMIFVFMVMNVNFALSFFPSLQNISYITFFDYLPVRALIGVIAIIKIQTASMVIKGGFGRGLGEKISHTLIAGLLITFGPEIVGFLWPLIIGKFF